MFQVAAPPPTTNDLQYVWIRCTRTRASTFASQTKDISWPRNYWSSWMPRSHPLMRENSLMNQVEFLGLAHIFVTSITWQCLKHFATHSLKKCWDTQVKIHNFTAGVCYVMIAISLVFSTLVIDLRNLTWFTWPFFFARININLPSAAQ